MAQAMDGLRALMKEKGWTQQRLADALGVRQASISLWLSGKVPMPAKRVAEVKEALGWVPDTGRGTVLVDGALADMEEFVLHAQPQTPLLYVLLAPMPAAVGDDHAARRRQGEYYASKVRAWAAYLGLSVEALIEAAVKKRPIGWEQVELVAKAGWKFAALGEHVARELSAAEHQLEVVDFLAQAAPTSLRHLREELDDWVEGRGKVRAYLDGYEAAAAWDSRYAELYPGLYDLDEQWRGYQEGQE